MEVECSLPCSQQPAICPCNVPKRLVALPKQRQWLPCCDFSFAGFIGVSYWWATSPNVYPFLLRSFSHSPFLAPLSPTAPHAAKTNSLETQFKEPFSTKLHPTTTSSRLYTHIILLCHFSIVLDQFSHNKDGDCTFFRNVELLIISERIKPKHDRRLKTS